MADNTINIKVRIDDKGNLSVLGKKAKAAGEGLERTAKSAQTADRNLKGAARTSSNSTKNFSKMAQGISGGLVPAYATLAAQVFAVTAAFQFFQSAFDFTNLIRGQEALGATTGVAYKTISNSLVEATEGQLRYAEAAKATAIGTAAGLNADQLERLGTVAKNVSLALGRDLTDSFNRLIRGTTKAEPELLDELGIVLRLDPALRNYANAIGKTKDELNAFERTQAVTNDVLEQGEQKFEKIAKLMDPDAFALQQFIRSFDDLLNTLKLVLAQGLTPVFQFLSQNTTALIGALAAFAAPIVKSILPNFRAWEEQSRNTSKAIGESLKAQKTRISDVAESYKRLGTAAQGQAVVEKALAGSRAKSAAVQLVQQGKIEQLSKRQITSLLSNAKRGRGAISGMSKKMAADYVAALELMLAKTQTTFDKITLKAKKTGTSIQLAFLRGGQIATAGLGLITRAAGLVAGAINIAFSAVAIVSLIALIKEAYDAWRNYRQGLDPVIQKQKELAEQTKDLIDKYNTLGEELARAASARATIGLLSLKDTVENLGNAVGSVNILDLAVQIENVDRNNQDLIASLTGTIRQLGAVDDSFFQLQTSLDSGVALTAEQVGELVELQRGYVASAEAAKGLTEGTKQITTALGNLSRSTRTSPLDEVISATNQQLERQAELIKSSEAALRELNSQLEISEFDNQGVIDQATLDEQNKAAVTYTEELKAQREELNRLQQINNEAVRIRQKLLDIDQLILKNTIAATKASTLGITFDERRINSRVDLANSTNKVLEAEKDIAAQNSIILGLKGTRTQEEEVVYENALQALAVAKDNKDLAVAEVELAIKRNQQSQYLINREETLLRFKEAQLRTTERINRLEIQRARAESGLTGSFGFERAAEVRQGNISSLQAQRARSQQEVQRLSRAIDLGQYQNETQRQADLEAREVANRRIADLSIEIEKRQKLVDIALLDLKAETQLAEARLEAVSLNPIQQAFNQKIIEFKQRGVELGLIEQESLLNEITAQQELMLLLENKQQIFTSITDNISNGLTSIIDGTKSVKQAFADMALNILRDIAQMIVKMMVFRAVSSFLPGAPALPPSFGSLDAASSINTAGVARNGGVFSEGRKMSYGVGGIARGPNSGYPVTLHGTEAVVPLPDGKSIPVQMSGANQQNNVTVNVAIDNQGNASTNVDQSGQGADIGRAVARAVQLELQNQKRSGGILSPYGAA